MITRRALVAAGAGLLLTGCGDEEEAVPADAELLGAALAVELALVAAYERLGGRMGEALAAQQRRHVARVRDALGGAPEPDAADDGAGGDPLEAALALERRAMAAYLNAVGLLRSADARTLAAELLTAGAQHASVLRARLGREPLETAFPDGTTA